MKPIIKFKVNIHDLKKLKNIKPNQSKFLLTTITNQKYKEDGSLLKDDIEIFDNSINQLLNNIDEYINIPDTDRWNDEAIKVVIFILLVKED